VPDISDILVLLIRTAGAIILMISHGYSVKEHDDPIVDMVEAAVSQFSECVEPGAYLVDMVPLCKSLFPHWPTTRGIDRVSSPSLEPGCAAQYKKCPTGSLERDGKRKPSDSPTR